MFHSCHRLKHFSIHQHLPAPLPRQPWLCAALENHTHSVAFQHRNGKWRSGRAVRWVLPAPFSNEGSASDARLGGPLGLTPGFFILCRIAPRGERDGITSLKANTHFSTSKQIPHAFNRNIHAFLVELPSQRGAPAEYATTADSLSKKKCILTE